MVELIVVVAIIAILMSFLLPALRAAKQAAMHTTCTTNLRTHGQAMAMYAGEQDGYFPDLGDVSTNQPWRSKSVPLNATANLGAPLSYFGDYLSLPQANPQPASAPVLYCPAVDWVDGGRGYYRPERPNKLIFSTPWGTDISSRLGYNFVVGRHQNAIKMSMRVRRDDPREILVADPILSRAKNHSGDGWEVVQDWYMNPHNGWETQPQEAAGQSAHQVLADCSVSTFQVEWPGMTGINWNSTSNWLRGEVAEQDGTWYFREPD